VQLQDVHKWSFGRPDPKASKGHDEGGSEDIPLEGLDNALAIQGSNGSHDRCVSVHMHWLACPGVRQVEQAHKFERHAAHYRGCSIAVVCLSDVEFILQCRLLQCTPDHPRLRNSLQLHSLCQGKLNHNCTGPHCKCQMRPLR